MGFIQKLANGNKTHFKVNQRCDATTDDGCYIVTSLSGKDLVKLVAESDSETMNELFTHVCSKCNITVDEVPLDELRGAKKIFAVKTVK